MSTASSRPFLSVIIPAYNEESRLPQTLAGVVDYLSRQSYASEIIIVDDGSSDNTAQVAESFLATHAMVRLIRNDHRGKGYAVRTGVNSARGHIVLFFDADASTPIEDIQKLLPWFERGFAIVIGSREGLGAKRVSEPFYRHFMGRVFNLIVRTLTVRGIQDTQCGFKALQNEAAKEIFAKVHLYGDNAKRVSGAMVTAYDVEMLFIGQKLGFEIKEIPVEWRYGTESKVNPIKDSWRNFKDVVKVRLNDARGKYNFEKTRGG